MGWGEIELRHDCDYYRPAHIRLLAKMNASGWPVVPLRGLSPHIVDGPFGSAIKAEGYVEEGVPFIRVADVTRGNGTIRPDQMIYISEEAHYAIRRSATEPGDIVVAKTGATMGAASIVPPTLPVANIRGDLALVGQLASPLDAKYLEAYFNSAIGYKLFWRLNSGSTRGRVVISNLKRYPVIWPDDQTKSNVVALLTEARQSVAALEAQAATLLASIDDYLLGELGIVLPPETENTLENRTFRLSAHELGGLRFDPFHHQTYFQAFDEALSEGKHPLQSLRNLYRTLVNGYDCRDFTDEGLPYLKVAQVKPFNLKIGDAQFIPETGVPARGLAQRGDLLLTRKGTYGDAALNRSHTPFAFSSEVFRLRLNGAKLNGDFAEAVLNSVLVRTQFKRHSIGAIMGSLSQSIFGKVLVPLPPLDEQQRLAKHCLEIRGRALELEAQATAELEAAKGQIEAILLGGAA